MSVLFASSYAGSLKPFGGPIATIASGIEATYTDAGMDVAGSNSVFQVQTPDFPVELTEGWVHCYMSVGSTTSYKAGNFFGLYNSVRNGWDIVAVINSSDQVNFQYWNGTTMASVGTATSLGSTGAYPYDLYFKKDGSNGIISIYRDGSLILSVTGLDLSHIAVNAARWRAMNSYLANAVLSQLLVAEESTVGAKVYTPDLSTGNSNTFVSGSVSDVSVDAIRIPNTFMTADTNDQTATFAVEDISTSLEVAAVCINTRAKKGATGPANLEMVARVGSTNYFSDPKALTVGMDPVNHVFDVNPATGLAWTVSILNSSEFGVRAKT